MVHFTVAVNLPDFSSARIPPHLGLVFLLKIGIFNVFDSGGNRLLQIGDIIIIHGEYGETVQT